MMRKVPLLVDLCVHLAIDNVRYLGDVGETDSQFLDRILCHCSLDQLTHIENSTIGRDLSPVTDKLWKKFYKDSFGEDSFNTVVEKMRQKKVTFKWRKLYEAKLQEREEATKKSLDRIKQRYLEADASETASNIYNSKSSIMKKSKIDFINSREVKNLAAMKSKVVHKTQSAFSKPKPVITSGSASSSSSSSSNLIRPFRRRF